MQFSELINHTRMHLSLIEAHCVNYFWSWEKTHLHREINCAHLSKLNISLDFNRKLTKFTFIVKLT